MKTILPSAPILTNPWMQPPALPRIRSRRREPRRYHLERMGPAAARQRREQHPPQIVDALTDAGRTGSALRRRLKELGMDPKLARLVLLFYRRTSLRVADVGWALNISPSTASRWLDRAEQQGLIEKQYDNFDRRGTWTRLTTRGVVFRGQVERLLERMATNERPRGVVWGIRGTPGWDE